MPIYEYECKYCQYAFEAIQGIKEKQKRKCPECGRRNALNKLMSMTNFALQGAGWAKDGYSKATNDDKKET